MKKIAYLHPDACSEIEQAENLKKQIIKHPEHKIYTLENFVIAFNAEQISDLGYIAIIDENKKGVNNE